MGSQHQSQALKTMFFVFFFISFSSAHSDQAESTTREQITRIRVPIADLRKQPISPSFFRLHDPIEQSQLLYGDPIEIKEGKSGWVRIEATEQVKWTQESEWHGYPGWVQNTELITPIEKWDPNLIVTAKKGVVRAKPSLQSAPQLILSFGTRLVGTISPSPQNNWWKLTLLDGTTGWISEREVTPAEKLMHLQEDPQHLRLYLISKADLFVGDPYYWGGRSSFNSGRSPHQGMDCSGFIGLLYQSAGLQIPRDAHEQWLQARPIERNELAPADLIFLSEKNNPKKIVHVMLYVGDGHIIEAPGTGQEIREMDLNERLSESPDQKAYFGTYLK